MNIDQKTICFTNNDDSFQYLSTLVRRPFTLVYVKEKAFVMHETTVFLKKTLPSELYWKPIKKEMSCNSNNILLGIRIMEMEGVHLTA